MEGIRILETGTKLFAGGKNESFALQVTKQLLNEECAFALLAKCDEKGHDGWIITKWWGNVKGEEKQFAETRVPVGEVGKIRPQIISMAQLKALLKVEDISEVETIRFEVLDDGYIHGLYLLDEATILKYEEYRKKVREGEKIIHTYTGELSNKNAIPNAKKVYAYLRDVYKKKCLTAQHESFWIDGPEYEMNLIKQFTGKLPAIRGLDFITNHFEGTTARSKEWWNKGGMVTICWHTGPDFASAFDECRENDLDWENAMTPGTEAYENLLAGMDRAVPYLRELQEAGVPVLWRPFHEFDGGWFWWGRGGSENFKKLWQLMYSRYTDFWGLNNLIWVLGYSNSVEDKVAWYPGDDYVDLLGADNYESGPDVDEDLYNKCVEVAPEGMPIVYHECGDIPCEEDMKRVPWLLFMPWYDWLLKGNTPEHLSEIYNSDYFITLDELPNLRSES